MIAGRLAQSGAIQELQCSMAHMTHQQPIDTVLPYRSRAILPFHVTHNYQQIIFSVSCTLDSVRPSLGEEGRGLHARRSLYSHSFLPPRLFDEFIADDDDFFFLVVGMGCGGGESGHRLRESGRRAGSGNSCGAVCASFRRSCSCSARATECRGCADAAAGGDRLRVGLTWK